MKTMTAAERAQLVLKELGDCRLYTSEYTLSSHEVIRSLLTEHSVMLEALERIDNLPLGSDLADALFIAREARGQSE